MYYSTECYINAWDQIPTNYRDTVKQPPLAPRKLRQAQTHEEEEEEEEEVVRRTTSVRHQMTTSPDYAVNTFLSHTTSHFAEHREDIVNRIFFNIWG